MPLTDVACRNAKASDKPIKLFDGQGLYLLVQPSGSKLWRLKYRFEGKEKLLALGAYPEVPLAGAFDKSSKKRVEGARERRADARRALSEGIDPSAQKKAQRRQRRAAADNSFEAVARAWWKQWSVGRSEVHKQQVLRRFESDVFPVIGSIGVAALTAQDVLAVALKIEKRGADDIAKRAYQTCGQVLRYAVAHGLATRNPAADIKPSDALKPARHKNYARLDVREVPELLRKIDAYDGSVYTRCALRLMALTFVRTSELIGASWDEFDLQSRQWRIPAERMKMKTPHIVPLSRQALSMLDELAAVRMGRTMVFPGERDHSKPMSNNTLLYALYRMGYHSRMTGHGFRGIASTVLHELGHRHDLIELQLAHSERDAISASYNWATYIPQRSEMMQTWADHLDVLRAGVKAVPFKAA
jgi:integrase